MNIEEPKSKRYVEIYATSNEGTTMIIRKLLYENWIDGYKYYGRYVNEKTINYISYIS